MAIAARYFVIGTSNANRAYLYDRDTGLFLQALEPPGNIENFGTAVAADEVKR